MRVFKYWVKHKKVLQIQDITQVSSAFGGSNISEHDAIEDAEKKLAKAQKIIDGKAHYDKEYEADIIEEVLYKIDDNNIITRNRYGAEVLNSSDHLIIDIDHYQSTWLDRLFNRSWTKKESILNTIRHTLKKKAYRKLSFRVYETFKGYRIFVLGKDFDPRSKESKKMMLDFKADNLYYWLCIKQNCYRARLTPKPYRMKQKRIKVLYPNRSPDEEAHLQTWLNEYDNNSSNFSTCRLVYTQGSVNPDNVVQYHDQKTKIRSNSRLA